jgi:predicted alpha/beta-hydrolase family hydrolase
VTRALLLTPGASATRDHPSLVAIEEAVAPVPCRRVDLPRPGPKPDRILEVIRREAGVLAQEAGLEQPRVALGGRSMGGRMCSMAVAAGFPALGLALVSYPLHPPGKPDQRRTAHLPDLRVPCLFVSGTRDAFGTPEELEAATASIPGPVTHVWVDGGDHGLRGKDATVAAAVREWLSGL